MLTALIISLTINIYFAWLVIRRTKQLNTTQELLNSFQLVGRKYYEKIKELEKTVSFQYENIKKLLKKW